MRRPKIRILHSGIGPADPRAGQSLIELSVFGAFFLLLLGTMLSRGMQSNFQQRAMMAAYRQAWAIAKDTTDTGSGTGSVMYVDDRMAPDPMDAFGIGSVVSGVASASVTQSWRMHAAPQSDDDLPKVVVNVRGGDTRNLTTAGYFYVASPSFELAEKYRQIYGTVHALGNGGWVPLSSGDYVPAYACVGTPPTDPGDGGNGGGGGTILFSCGYARIRVLDPCLGEIISYDTCRSLARQVTDPAYCVYVCENTRLFVNDDDDAVDCSAICSSVMPATGGMRPWYAQGDWEATLNDFFRFSPVVSKAHQATGVQGGSTIRLIKDLRMEKDETNDAIVTEDSGGWGYSIQRDIVAQDRTSPGTWSESSLGSSVGDSGVRRWETPK